MSNEGEPPPAVAIDLYPAAQLTRAVVKKGEICFDLRVSTSNRDPDLAEGLRSGFFGELPLVPGERFGPISVEEDKRDKSKITVVYKPDGPRKPGQDRARIVSVFEELDIPITKSITEGIQQAFDALEALNAQGHSAAEVARRNAKKRPPDRRSR
jgi:hypothetical protein